MIYELRVYTVKPGTLREFSQMFGKEFLPIHKSLGFQIVGAWRHEDKSQFVWMRRFNDEADRKAKMAALENSKEWQALRPRIRENIVDRDIRDLAPTDFSPLK